MNHIRIRLLGGDKECFVLILTVDTGHELIVLVADRTSNDSHNPELFGIVFEQECDGYAHDPRVVAGNLIHFGYLDYVMSVIFLIRTHGFVYRRYEWFHRGPKIGQPADVSQGPDAFIRQPEFIRPVRVLPPEPGVTFDDIRDDVPAHAGVHVAQYQEFLLIRFHSVEP